MKVMQSFLLDVPEEFFTEFCFFATVKQNDVALLLQLVLHVFVSLHLLFKCLTQTKNRIFICFP